MRNLNSRSFVWAWQALYGASNPNHLKDHWRVDGVEWRKERHAYWGVDYSVQHEVHRLEYRHGNKQDWELLVVVERWWGADRDKSIRDICWARAITGRPDRILAWLRKQGARQPPIEATTAASNV
ncbi:MAG TPA: hypothetical protein VLX09_14120 [Stellaceae bacterium]|nr:hypothetical protein [Stellaceae bacterium]